MRLFLPLGAKLIVDSDVLNNIYYREKHLIRKYLENVMLVKLGFRADSINILNS